MKKLFAIAAAALMISFSAAAEPYVFAGGSAGDKVGGLAAGAGVRSSNVGLEASYIGEHQKAETLTSSGSAIAHQDASRSWHGAGLGLIGFAPIAMIAATGVPLELVGRIERARLRSGDLEEWRTSVGAGVQYGSRSSWAGRVLVDRAGDQTRASVFLLYGF